MKKSLFVITLVVVLLPSAVLATASNNAKANEKRTVQAERAEEIKARVEALKEAKASDKTKLETQLLVKVKEKANAEIDRIAAKYDRLIARVEKMAVISEEKKTEVKTSITAAKTEIVAYKERVNEATTVAEVRTVMQELKTKARKNSEMVKQVVAAIHTTHLENTVKKLTAVLEKLEAKGADQTKITTTKTQLAEASAFIKGGEYKNAKEKILESRKTLLELAQEVKEDQTKNAEDDTTEEGR